MVEDGSAFSTREMEADTKPTKMDVLIEAGAVHYVPLHTGMVIFVKFWGSMVGSKTLPNSTIA